MPDHSDFDIIGEHRTDSCRFLVLDADGTHAVWHVDLGTVTPVEAVNWEEWRLDVDRDRVAARVADGRR